MKNLLKSCFGAALVAALFVSVPVVRAAMAPSGGDTQAPGAPAVVANIPVPSGMTPDHIKAAIIEGLAPRKWVAQEVGPGQITATYSRGSMSLALAIAYNTKEVTVTVAQWDSRPRAQKTQERWFANAKKDIADELVRRSALTK